MSDTPEPFSMVPMLGMMMIQEQTIERLRILALEWHGKHIPDARFSIRTYEILCEHDQAMKAHEGRKK